VTTTAARAGPIGSSGVLSGFSSVIGHGHHDAAAAIRRKTTTCRRVLHRGTVAWSSGTSSTSSPDRDRP
jgi:hypothetical protein